MRYPGDMLGLRAPKLVALAALAALGATGCRVFDESLLVEDASVDVGPADGGVEDVGPPIDAGCVLNHPPGRILVEDGDTGEELVFALRDLVLDQRAELWASIGYDLDGLCSTGPEPVVECRTPQTGAAPEMDGMGGTDNSFGHHFPLLLFTHVSDFRARFDSVHLQGRGLPVLRLQGWNGEDNDPKVDVVLAHSVRAEPAPSDGGTADAGTMDAGLAWSGDDVFYVRSTDFVGGDPARPNTHNDNAYVARRTLAVPLPERVQLSWEGEGLVFSLKLTDPILTARISEDARTLEEVTIAGRWSVFDVLDSFQGLGFCPDSESQASLERLLDESADIRETPGTGSPETSCDAISVGVRLTGYRGTWGGLEPATPPPAPCSG